MGQDVIIDFTNPGQEYRRPQLTPWELSLRRVARAQALLWHSTDIPTRIRLLAAVDREMAEQEKP